MKYVMLICDDPSNYTDLTEQEQKRAYDEIFADHPEGGRRQLFGGTAEAWYGRL